jgi:hypothetical protein
MAEIKFEYTTCRDRGAKSDQPILSQPASPTMGSND